MAPSGGDIKEDPYANGAGYQQLETPTWARRFNRRRGKPRVAARGDAMLLSIDQTVAQQRSVSVKLRNVGWGGFGFLCQEALDVDSQWLALFLDGGRQVAQQTLRVCHCREAGDRLYRVGSQVCVGDGLVSLLGVDRYDLEN